MRILLFAGLYYLIFVYPWSRLIGVLAPEYLLQASTLAALLTGPAVVWLVSRTLASPLKFWLSRAAYVWLGASWLALCVSLPFELLYLGAHVGLVPVAAKSLAYMLCVVVAGLFVLGCVNANRLRVQTITLTDSRLTSPIRALQLSDVHIGSRSPLFLRRVVNASNALSADIIFITGDLIDGHAISRSQLAALGQLDAPTYFCIGNHERYVDCDSICKRLRGLGIHVLRDAYVSADVCGNALTIIGIDDADDPGRVREGLAALDLPARHYRVLLYHRPDGLEDAASHGVNLMLSGHTHNGQMVPFNALVRRRFPRIQGLFKVAETTLYVSVGTGTWGPPLRLGSVNELTLVELQPGDG